VNQKKIALLLMVASAFVHGVFSIWARTSPYATADIFFPYLVLQLFLGMFLIFLWLRGDEVEFRYHRSAMMNVGIAALALVFIPIYLYRTRPRGQKIKAIGLCFLLLPASFVCAFAGGIAGALVFGLPKA